MSFGIGAFPFGIFATAFNINDGRPPPGKTPFLGTVLGIPLELDIYIMTIATTWLAFQNMPK